MRTLPKLIATDLDGTLLRSDGTLSVRTVAALRAAQARGVHVVIATARPFRALRPIVEPPSVQGWGVCQNGAVVYELTSLERVLKWELEHLLARRIVTELRRKLAGVVFACEFDDVFHCEPAFEARLQALEPPHITYGDALDLITAPITKLLVHHPSFASSELAAAVARLVGDHVAVTHSGAAFVEISAAGVTKASGLAALCERLAIDAADVMACGDMPNDLPMLHWAGYRVAMANAHPDVLAAADEIAPSNDEDGVAALIERLIASAGPGAAFLPVT